AEAAPPPSLLEIAGRALSYAGIALGLGTAFFVLFVAPVGIDPRRESWLLSIAGVLVVGGSLALIVDQGAKLPPRLGVMLGVRAFAGLVLAAVSITPRLAMMRPVAAIAGGGVMTIGPLATVRPRRMIALAAGIAAAMTATLVSHATALGALALGVLNLLGWSQRLRAAIRARTAVRRGTMAETGIFIVIIVAASVLTALAPPAQPSASAYDSTQHVSGLRLEMLVASGG